MDARQSQGREEDEQQEKRTHLAHLVNLEVVRQNRGAQKDARTRPPMRVRTLGGHSVWGPHKESCTALSWGRGSKRGMNTYVRQP